MTGAAVFAAVAAAVAVLVAVPPSPRRRLQPGRPPGWSHVAAAARRWLVGRWRPARTSARRRAAAIEVADALAAELRAGRSVREALVRASAAHVPPPCPAAVAACRLGGDVVSALRDDARRSGAALWVGVAACWSVAESSGAGLATAVDRVVAGARADEEVRREIDAALAAPRATAKVLAVLPLFGIALGTALGADPVGWLLATPLGIGVLMAGVACAAAGVWWTGRIADAVASRL